MWGEYLARVAQQKAHRQCTLRSNQGEYEMTHEMTRI